MSVGLCVFVGSFYRKLHSLHGITNLSFLVRNLILVQSKCLVKTMTKQECIPVGCVPCVPSAAVAISPVTHIPCHACHSATHTPPATHAPLGHACPYHACLPTMHAPLNHMQLLPCMPPCHVHPLPCMPHCHACHHPTHATPTVDRILDTRF